MYRYCLPFAVVFLLAAVLGHREATAASTSLTVETMKVALHTATVEEEGFLTKVLAMVDTGTLPLELVESTFPLGKEKATL